MRGLTASSTVAGTVSSLRTTIGSGLSAAVTTRSLTGAMLRPVVRASTSAITADTRASAPGGGDAPRDGQRCEDLVVDPVEQDGRLAGDRRRTRRRGRGRRPARARWPARARRGSSALAGSVAAGVGASASRSVDDRCQAHPGGGWRSAVVSAATVATSGSQPRPGAISRCGWSVSVSRVMTASSASARWTVVAVVAPASTLVGAVSRRVSIASGSYAVTWPSVVCTRRAAPGVSSSASSLVVGGRTIASAPTWEVTAAVVWSGSPAPGAHSSPDDVVSPGRRSARRGPPRAGRGPAWSACAAAAMSGSDHGSATTSWSRELGRERRPPRPASRRPAARGGDQGGVDGDADLRLDGDRRGELSQPSARPGSSSTRRRWPRSAGPSSEGADGGPTTGTSTETRRRRDVVGRGARAGTCARCRPAPCRRAPRPRARAAPTCRRRSRRSTSAAGTTELDRRRSRRAASGAATGAVASCLVRPSPVVPADVHASEVGARADAEPADPQGRAGLLDHLVAVVAQGGPHARGPRRAAARSARPR